MVIYDTISKLCDKSGIAITALETELGLGRGLIGKWKNGTSPNLAKLKKIADYFSVSVDYLLTGEEKKWQPTLTDKDEKDLDKKVKNLLNAVDSDTGLMLDGEIMDEETREIFAMNLKNALRTTKLAAKAKYTPNKYRK